MCSFISLILQTPPEKIVGLMVSIPSHRHNRIIGGTPGFLGHICLEPQTTIKKWMFGETTISYVKIGNHPIETTIYKWLFGVPGGSLGKITFHESIETPSADRFLLVGKPDGKHGLDS